MTDTFVTKTRLDNVFGDIVRTRDAFLENEMHGRGRTHDALNTNAFPQGSGSDAPWHSIITAFTAITTTQHNHRYLPVRLLFAPFCIERVLVRVLLRLDIILLLLGQQLR